MGASLNLIVEKQRLTQAEVATALGINQPEASALMSYKLEGFSVERLMHFLVALRHISSIKSSTRKSACCPPRTISGSGATTSLHCGRTAQTNPSSVSTSRVIP